MELTLQKTVTFILFILIGVLLKLKFNSKEEISGIKKIILNLALPATIFIALLEVTIDAGLLILPFIGLFFNILLFIGFPYILPLLGIKKNTPTFRTARILLPSLAPGLSCFPFVLEFLGEYYLAKAAMTDLGNKVFVLIILYVIAMNWHYRLHSKVKNNSRSKLKSLFLAMISEPVNIFIVIALILVFLGLSLESLPIFISDTVLRLSTIMTPLVLLFIGLSVKIRKNQLLQLVSLLSVRAGIAVLVSGFFITLSGVRVQNEILLVLALALSACSFWPFAHISSIMDLEKNVSEDKKTFNGNFAINILALSFPFSTILILGVFSGGAVFSSIYPIFILALALLFIGFLPVLVKRIWGLGFASKKGKYKVSATESL
ncbi:MAG: permease [Bacteroidota bacterium]